MRNINYYQEDVRFINSIVSEKKDPRRNFLQKCKHFIDGSCASSDWSLRSICNNCYKEKKYMPFSIIEKNERGA